MDPITILAGLKTGLAAGKSVASLSKQIGQFFDATDSAKKKLQQKGVSGKRRSNNAPIKGAGGDDTPYASLIRFFSPSRKNVFKNRTRN